MVIMGTDISFHTTNYILETIAQSAHEAFEVGDRFYISSCHSAVGFWLACEPTISDDDEIVLLGRSDLKDNITHSIIIRDGEIVGDTEAIERGIHTQYDPDSGRYKTMHSKRLDQEVEYVTIHKISVGDFRKRHLMQPTPPTLDPMP